MADEPADDSGISDADLDKLVAEIFSIDDQTASTASDEVAEITPDAAQAKQDLAKIAQEQDAKKRDDLVEQLKKKTPALFETAVPELADWSGDDDDVELVDDPPAGDSTSAPAAEAGDGGAQHDPASTDAVAAGSSPAAASQPVSTTGPATSTAAPASRPPIQVVRASQVMANASQASQQQSSPQRSASSSQPQRAPGAKTLTRAQDMAIAVVVADVIGLLMSLFGFAVGGKKYVNLILTKTPRNWRYGLRTIGTEFKVAKAAGDKTGMAKVCVKVILGMCNVLSVKSVARLVFGAMTPTDWVKAGVAFVAQLGLWFATAGAALLLRLALVVWGAAELGIDAVQLSNLMDK